LVKRMNRWARSRNGLASIVGTIVLLFAVALSGHAVGWWDLGRLMGTAYGTQSVALSNFSGTFSDGQIRVVWSTSNEVNNQGFHLWRATTLTGRRDRMNSALISPKGPGSTYEWIDEPGRNPQVYYYWLDDVSIYGIVTQHGPISVSTGGIEGGGTIVVTPVSGGRTR
jgi:hypothetical protein